MGVAPVLVPVAVNVTGDPWQIVVAEAATDTEGVAGVVTVIVIVLLVAVTGKMQAALLVNTQEMISPLLNVLSV